MKTVALVQARMESSRLPKKVMKLINGKPLIELLLTRLSQSKKIDQIALVTYDSDENLLHSLSRYEGSAAEKPGFGRLSFFSTLLRSVSTNNLQEEENSSSVVPP